MSKSLVIVESPAKAKTISKYLGKDFTVEASVGHIKDLPKNRIGVDLSDGSFTPELIVIPGKEKVVDRLKKLAKASDIIYLAPAAEVPPQSMQLAPLTMQNLVLLPTAAAPGWAVPATHPPMSLPA